MPQLGLARAGKFTARARSSWKIPAQTHLYPVHTEWSKPLQTCIQYKFWIFKKFCTTLTASNLHDMQNQIKEKNRLSQFLLEDQADSVLES